MNKRGEKRKERGKKKRGKREGRRKGEKRKKEKRKERSREGERVREKGLRTFRTTVLSFSSIVLDPFSNRISIDIHKTHIKREREREKRE